jgi:hypothetical protein
MATTTEEKKKGNQQQQQLLWFYRLSISTLLCMTVSVGSWGLSRFMIHERLPSHPVAAAQMLELVRQLRAGQKIQLHLQKELHNFDTRQQVMMRDIKEIKEAVKK